MTLLLNQNCEFLTHLTKSEQNMSSVIAIVSYGLGWPSEINNIVKAAIPFYVSDMCGTFV